MRRAAFLFAGAAALVPSGVLRAEVAGPVAGVAAGPARFTPPGDELVLTRTVHRALGGGLEIVARRSYAIRFVPDGLGFRVDGRLIDSHVDAPAGLSALAAIERQRPDTGMFPMRLDAEGRLTDAASARDDEAKHKASAIAALQVGGSDLSAAEKSQAGSFLTAVAARGAGSAEWPRDLFRPQPGNRRESRRLALPSGGEGTVTVAIAARAAPSDGLLEAVERTVMTDLGGTRRETREEWTLARAPS